MSDKHPVNRGLVMQTAWIPEAVRERVRQQARGRGFSVSEYVAIALERYEDELYAKAIARVERDRARADARILAHSYTHDSNPPADVVKRALGYPVAP